MGFNHDDPGPNDDTDVGTLWQEALIKYHEECGTDLQAMPLSRRNLTHIKAEQDRQLLLFSEYRHDKGKLDRLRNLISTNSDIVLSVASHIATAASSAFPPSSALLTAFNYVMNASRAVSEDYDMIVSFFDIMNSFLERISLLESRKPSDRQFNRFLVNVFSAMMTLSAIARKCRMKGRLRKWAKALIDGSDPNLKGAFDALHMHLQRFESVVMLSTLKYTLEGGKKLDAIGEDVKRIQDGVERNITLTEDAATTSHEILTVVTRHEERGAEYTAGLHQVMKTLNKMSKPKDAPNELHVVDAGARKSIAMRILDGAFDYFPEERGGLAAFESYYIQGTCDWFRAQDVYMGLERGTVRLLWVSGPAGMGKSTLAYTVVKSLQEEFIDDTTVSVAYCFFVEDDWRRHVTQMLQSCVMQIAGRDTRYREEAVAEVQMWDKLLDHGQASGSLRMNNDKMWELFYQNKFSDKTGRRLFLVLDGVDEVVKEDYPFIDMILEEVATSEDLKIQVIFTSESRGLKPGPKASGTEVFELTKEFIMPDIQTIIIDRLKRVERLRKLSQGVKRMIVTKLSKKADTMRYVDHILRRLEQLGRERAVLRELNNLPDSTDKLYEMLLNDCQKGRNDQEIVVLRHFFAWLAYTTDVLSLGPANKLLRYISEDTTIDVDEEVEQGCSRILRLTRAQLTGGGQEDSDACTEDLNDELYEDEDGDLDDFLLVVGFQEKGLRNYFRPSENLAGDKLRMTEREGHLAVLRIIESILCTETDRWDDVQVNILQGYASKGWHRHLRAIDREKLTQEERASVAESIYRILSNSGGSLKKPERQYSVWDSRQTLPCVFGDKEEEITATLSCLHEWALSLTQASPSLVSDATLGWLQQVARNPKELFIQAAEIHVRNWFQRAELEDEDEVSNPFRFAHYALYQGKSLSSLQQNERLVGYLSRCGNDGEVDRYTWGPEPNIIVCSAFPHIDITAQGYLSVALSMLEVGMYEPALEQLHLAIPLAATDLELMEIFARMAEVIVRDAWDARRIQSRPFHSPEGKNDAGLEGTADRPGSETTDGVDGAHKEEHEEKYDEWASRALHAATKAADIALKLPETAMEDTRVRNLVGNIWMYKATAELMSGDATNTVAYCQRVAKSLKRNNIYCDFYIIDLLEETNRWTTLLEVIRTFLVERGAGFSRLMQSYKDAIHRAAKATGQIEYILEQYEDTISSRDKMNMADGDLLIGYARFCHDVVATAEGTSKAKGLLDNVIDAKGSSEHITEAFFCLSDILLEEFHHATLGEEKREAYDRMQDVMRRVSESRGAEFDPTQSQTVIPLAHMARKMNAIEFQRGIERTFRGCVAALTDETGWNDRLSLRMLARVLAVMGLERDAQIAATSQVYVLNMDIYRREQHPDLSESDDGSIDLGGSKMIGTSDIADDGTKAMADQDATSSNNSVALDPSHAGAYPSGLLVGDVYWRSGDVCCADCKEDWAHWSQSYPVYLCYYCAELELCQACFDKRAKRIAGEASDDWRVFCPEGHKHLRLPVEGWEGLSDGVLWLGGGEKVPFKEWLDEIKDKKWPEAWTKFWSEEP